MKTDLELQKMLAEELPELIEHSFGSVFNPKEGLDDKDSFHFKDNGREITDREWLFVTAECEKKLRYPTTQVQWSIYLKELQKIISNSVNKDSVSFEFETVVATWRQRAIAYFKTVGKL